MESKVSGLLDNNWQFPFYGQENFQELWIPASNANTSALFDNTIEILSSIGLIAVLK